YSRKGFGQNSGMTFLAVAGKKTGAVRLPLIFAATALLHLAHHVVHRGCDLFVAGGGGTTRRHGTLSLNGDADHFIHALGDERFPGRLVTQLGRTGHAGGVAGQASRLVKFFTGSEVDVGGGRSGLCLGSLGGRRRCGGCFGSGGSSRLRSGRGLFCLGGRFARSGFTFTAFGRRFGEVGAALVGHVGDGTRDFDIAQVGVATPGRHGVQTVDGVLDQVFEALGDERPPGGGIAQLGRTGHAGSVTGGTGRRIDLFTRAFLAGRIGGDQRKTGNRLNAFGHGFLRLGVGADTERRARNHQPD